MASEIPKFSPENNALTVLKGLDEDGRINNILNKDNTDEGEQIWASELVSLSKKKAIIDSSAFDSQID